MLKNKILTLTVLFCSFSAFSDSIIGSWQSDCQNFSSSGFNSLRPIDTFLSEGKAILKVFVYSQRNCMGKESLNETIDCEYLIGQPVTGLSNTYELDLACMLEGKTQFWFEIAEISSSTLRFGKQTGLSKEERPKALGNVYYRKLTR